MQRRHLRQLTSGAVPIAPSDATGRAAPPPLGVSLRDFGLTPRDDAIFRLHTAAEIEHALLVQYLYAAYSVGGPQVPASHQAEVNVWQGTLLTIAKEEMGHLITVQNLLLLLGGPLHFERDEFPIHTEFYPFPFILEPLSEESLARYVLAEKPDDANVPAQDRQLVEAIKSKFDPQGKVNRVGLLYSYLSDLFSRPSGPQDMKPHLADEDFRTDATNFQAKAANWGAGDGAGLDVMVPPVTNRNEALAALKHIAEQGEGSTMPPPNSEPPHFQRFVDLYRKFTEVKGWSPTRCVATNPNTSSVAPPGPAVDLDERGRISDPVAQLWARLFNVRYRILLNCLAHFLHVATPVYDATGGLLARGYLLVWTFNEMRRLRKIARKLVELPLKHPPSMVMAGAPFELPYSLDLPLWEDARWRLHRDVLDSASRIIKNLIPLADKQGKQFLEDLAILDTKARAVAVAAGSMQPLPQPVEFLKVLQFLEEAIRGFNIQGPHKAFWRNLTRDNFVRAQIPTNDDPVALLKNVDPGYTQFDADGSNLYKAVIGKLDILGPQLDPMPLYRPHIPDERIRFLHDWIARGCPVVGDPNQKIDEEADPVA